MDIKQFELFDKVCSEHLAGVIDKILSEERKESACAIGFITTDDFYGFYLTWQPGNDTKGCELWEKALYPDFLYTPLVEIVDACDDIDFCKESEEKWEFAQTLLSVLEKNIRQIPEEIFYKNNFQREDILFFATMSDGDFIEKLLRLSVHMLNGVKAED
ncbi:MAG: hypothetical protein HFI91_15035 [Lachnospiraceae bacterium]|nr:hypothetical protein [Lachnospiraceae bacterium]